MKTKKKPQKLKIYFYRRMLRFPYAKIQGALKKVNIHTQNMKDKVNIIARHEKDRQLRRFIREHVRFKDGGGRLNQKYYIVKMRSGGGA